MIHWRTNIEYEAGQYPWIALLDVFFILLVFFLISNSVVFWPGTKLETALSLPTASSAKLQEADKLIVTITRSGQIFFSAMKSATRLYATLPSPRAFHAALPRRTS